MDQHGTHPAMVVRLGQQAELEEEAVDVGLTSWR
jgi:hypothetical protein